MIRDHPQGADLLAEARHVLSKSVLPGLTSETRYKVLMVLRAMNLTERELRYNPELQNKIKQRLSQLVASGNTVQDRFSVLSKSIRDGAFDASEELHEFLLLVTAYKLKETGASNVSEKLMDKLEQLP